MKTQIRHCRGGGDRSLSDGQRAIIREHYPHLGTKVLKRLPGVALCTLRKFVSREHLLITPAARAARWADGGRTRQGQPRGPIRDGTVLHKIDTGDGLRDPNFQELRNALHGARVALDQSIADAESALADCRRFTTKIETIVAALLKEEA